MRQDLGQDNVDKVVIRQRVGVRFVLEDRVGFVVVGLNGKRSKWKGSQMLPPLDDSASGQYRFKVQTYPPPPPCQFFVSQIVAIFVNSGGD